MEPQTEEEKLSQIRKEKQIYLRKEIIESGHDPVTFQDYLDSLKSEGGSNIDQWTSEELQQIVVEFKSKYPQNLSESEINRSNSYDKSATLDQIENIEPDYINEDQNLQASYDNKDYENTIKCLQNDVLVDEKEKFYILIKDFKIQEGGLFSSKHVNFVIYTNPFGWEVQRRYSDFCWLKKSLAKLYPHFFIPPLPSKKLAQKYDIPSILKRKELMEIFLNDLIKSKEMKNNKIVIDFLCLVDNNSFQLRKKQIDKLKKQKKLEENDSVDGQINLLINKESNNLARNLNYFLFESEIIYKKLKKTSQQLKADYNQLSITLSNMGDLFTKLYDLTTKLNSSISETKFTGLDIAFITLNNAFNSWSSNLYDQIGLLDKKLCNFFKYQKLELSSFKEILKTRNINENEYKNFSIKLKAKKERLFQLNDPSKWEIDFSKLPSNVNRKEYIQNLKKNKEECFKIMLTKETSIENDLRDQFAFFNYYFYNETKRSLEEKLNRYKNHFINFSVLQSDYLSNMHLLWADANTYLTLGSSNSLSKFSKISSQEEIKLKK